MTNFDDVRSESTKEYDPSWPQIPDHPYKILVLGEFWISKTNALFNPIKQQLGDDYCIIDELY